MIRRAISSLLLPLGLVGSVQAQPGPQPKSQAPSKPIGAEIAAVSACVRHVRQGVSHKRCMQDKGYPADLH